MELFDKNCIYPAWDKELMSHHCFVGMSVVQLEAAVNSKNKNLRFLVDKNPDESSDLPFVLLDKALFVRYVYYDPNYHAKMAFLRGLPIQYKQIGTPGADWTDFTGPSPNFTGDFYWRPTPSVHNRIQFPCKKCVNANKDVHEKPCCECSQLYPDLPTNYYAEGSRCLSCDDLPICISYGFQCGYKTSSL